jgi:hypothetical protein
MSRATSINQHAFMISSLNREVKLRRELVSGPHRGFRHRGIRDRSRIQRRRNLRGRPGRGRAVQVDPMSVARQPVFNGFFRTKSPRIAQKDHRTTLEYGRICGHDGIVFGNRL